MGSSVDVGGLDAVRAVADLPVVEIGSAGSSSFDPSLFPISGSLRRQRLRNTADEFDYTRAMATLNANVKGGAKLLSKQIDDLMAADGNRGA